MKHKIIFFGAFLVNAALSSTIALATEGYFQNGVSIRDKGIAGAGSADPQTPLVIAQNPAGLAEIHDQLELGASLFSPRRQYTGSGGPGFTQSGTVESRQNYFGLPTLGVSKHLDKDSALGIALYGNGGLNTNYGAPANPACSSPPLPAANGPFCGGNTGVDLTQVFVAAGYSRKIGNYVSIGVSPVLGFQMIRINGLAAFSYNQLGQPLSVDPSKLTNNGYDTSTGVGGRIGILIKPIPQLRFAASYQSQMKMSHFNKYAGLFANGGSFNVPSNYTLGVAANPAPKVTLLFDYRHINYKDVASVSDSSLTPAQFGSTGGPGFGWSNVDAYKLGLEVKTSPALTLRAGYAFNNNPISPSDVTINILAPGTTTQHFTLGGRVKTGKSSALEVSLLYAPNGRTTGIEITPAGPNPGHQITLQMHQLEFGVAWTHRL
jgi:long-chain fatty acid transport protein